MSCIGGNSVLPNMIWSRISSRRYLSPYLKTLQHFFPEPRYLSTVPEGSKKFIVSSAGFWQNFCCKICARKFRPEFRIKLLNFSYRPTIKFFLPSNYSSSSSHASRGRKSQKTLLYLTALMFAMFGSSYASVPLYRRFCQVTGYGGTVHRLETVDVKIARHDRDETVSTREIAVQFNSDVADGMQWKFIPVQREVRVKPGENALAFYTTENKSSTPIIGVSTYNVTQMKGALYFNKKQCICFEEQRLLRGEQIDMPNRWKRQGVKVYKVPYYQTTWASLRNGSDLQRIKHRSENVIL